MTEVKKWFIQGRWQCYVRDHPFLPRGQMAYARFVMAEQLGRPLLGEEIVHHINEDCTDDQPENLAIMNRPSHTSRHLRGVPKTLDHRLKMSQRMMGTQIHKGYKHSEEAKAKMRVAKLGKPLSEEHKAKLRGHTYNRSRKHTLEARARMGRYPRR